MLLKLKRVDKDIEDFDKAKTVLENDPRERSTNKNINLKLDRDLLAMKPQLDEKTYDITEHYTHFARKVKEDKISDENLPQAAFEYQRSFPLKVKFTLNEMNLKCQQASDEARKDQKAIDDEVLARREAEMHSIDGELKVIKKWEEAELVHTSKGLEKMGFPDWLIQRPPSPPQAPTSHVTQTSAKYTSHNQVDSQVIVVLDRNFGFAKAGGYITTLVTMQGCSEPVKLNVQGPFVTKWNYSYKAIPGGTPFVKGELTV